jgi:KTSC domain-containing protein
MPSVSIRAIGYDEDREELWIEYRSRLGGYSYFNVPPDVYDELMEAGSRGGYVNAIIKPNYRRYLYRACPPPDIHPIPV